MEVPQKRGELFGQRSLHVGLEATDRSKEQRAIRG